jgi:hypothetical protein
MSKEALLTKFTLVEIKSRGAISYESGLLVFWLDDFLQRNKY